MQRIRRSDDEIVTGVLTRVRLPYGAAERLGLPSARPRQPQLSERLRQLSARRSPPDIGPPSVVFSCCANNKGGRAGWRWQCTWILGLPGFRVEDVETVAVARRLPAALAQIPASDTTAFCSSHGSSVDISKPAIDRQRYTGHHGGACSTTRTSPRPSSSASSSDDSSASMGRRCARLQVKLDDTPKTTPIRMTTWSECPEKSGQNLGNPHPNTRDS